MIADFMLCTEPGAVVVSVLLPGQHASAAAALPSSPPMWPMTVVEYAQHQGRNVRTVRDWIYGGHLAVLKREGMQDAITEEAHLDFRRGRKPVSAGRKDRERLGGG